MVVPPQLKLDLAHREISSGPQVGSVHTHALVSRRSFQCLMHSLTLASLTGRQRDTV